MYFRHYYCFVSGVSVRNLVGSSEAYLSNEVEGVRFKNGQSSLVKDPLVFSYFLYDLIGAGYQFDYVFDWTILKYPQVGSSSRARVSSFSEILEIIDVV